MIIPKGDTLLSIRDIKFDGAAQLDGQKRGENLVTIHYQILTRMFDEVEGKTRLVVVKDHTAVFNGEFGDEEFGEMLLAVKKLAVKALQEANHDEKRDIDAAVAKSTDKAPKPADAEVS